jgi:hypothetical protein
MLEQPPAIVREVEDEKSVHYWHDVAVNAEKQKSLSNLKHAEALYHIHENENYKKLGFKSISEYVFKYFSRSASWANKLISIHKKFVIELEQSPETLEEVTFGKLSQLVSIVNEGNVDEVLRDAKKMTQQDISKKVREENGLAANETVVEENISKLVFKGPTEAMEIIKQAIVEAKEEYATETGKKVSDIIEFQALELIAVNYLNIHDMIDGNPRVALENTLHKLTSMYNIDIEYSDREQTNE